MKNRMIRLPHTLNQSPSLFLRAMARSLLTQAVPESWSKFYEGNGTALDWLKELAAKSQKMRKWLEKVRGKQLNSSPLFLADLFHPEVFLSALKQKAARIMKEPIDCLTLALEPFSTPREYEVTVRNITLLYSNDV